MKAFFLIRRNSKEKEGITYQVSGLGYESHEEIAIQSIDAWNSIMSMLKVDKCYFVQPLPTRRAALSHYAYNPYIYINTVTQQRIHT